MKIAVILTAVDRMSSVFGKALNSAQSKMQKVSAKLNSFADPALIAGGIGTAFFASSFKAAEESELAIKKVSNAWKNSGQDVATATKFSIDYANQLQNQIAVEDEIIMGVQTKLATFKSAANEQARTNGVFKRGIEAAFDMQATGFGEAEQNIVQLGKALNDPVKGITALSRSGITFTEQEKKKIAALIKANKLYTAQDILLTAIEKQGIKGAAAAQVTASQKAAIAWGELQETIGQKVLPTFNKFIDIVSNKVIPAIQTFVNEHPFLVEALAAISVGLLVAGTAAKIFSAVMMMNPVILIITAIAVSVFLIYKNWAGIVNWFKTRLNAIADDFKSVWNYIKSIPSQVYDSIVAKWNSFIYFFSDLWEGIKGIASGAWNAIGDVIMWPINKIKEAWEGLKTWFKDLWEDIKGIAVDMIGGPAGVANGALRRAAEAQAQAQQAASASTTSAVVTNFIKQPAAPSIPVRQGGGSTSFSIAPTYNITASSEIDFEQQLRKHTDLLSKTIEEANRRRGRLSY